LKPEESTTSSSQAGSTPDLETWDVLVGKVVARWDHSQLKIQPMDASAHRFDAGAQLCLELGKQRRLITILSSQPQGKAFVCDLGILAMEEAEALRGATLWIHRSMRPPLPEGEFYVDEMLGFQVQTESGEKFGEIIEIIETPAHNVYATENAMIPAHPDFIVSTDWENKILTVLDIPGLKN
jgi:16S rRNA processing protein RimM